MKKWLIRGGIALLVILGIAGTRLYFQLKEHGVIPRADYETVAPDIPRMERPAVLVFNKTNGYIHKDAIPAADALLTQIADKNGWDIFFSNNGATHSQEVLQNFYLVVWNNVSGDVLTENQRNSFKQWLEQGGGWVGLHATGGDFSYKWDWYAESLIGAQFVGHTMHPQFQDADVYKTDKGLDLTSHLPSPWNVKQEEWYAFGSNPRDKGYEILLTLDEDSYSLNRDSWLGTEYMEGEHPIAWRHTVAEGRALYSAIGHSAATYQTPEYQEFINRSMQWAIKNSPPLKESP